MKIEFKNMKKYVKNKLVRKNVKNLIPCKKLYSTFYLIIKSKIGKDNLKELKNVTRKTK